MKLLTLEDQMKTIERLQSRPPVPVIRIAKALGLRVYSVPGWDDDLSGMIKRSDDGTYEIYFNAGHSQVRQRFTVAHEIAHYVLHLDAIGDGITEDALYRSGLSNRQEAQANRLAADILMPWPLLDRLIDDGETNIERLATIFGVSKSAMSIRLGVPYETN